MKQSQLFTKIQREAPKDEVSKNAQLLIRAGFVDKQTAGAYAFLPLGLRVLNKIITIIREEMNALGGQEILLTALQNTEVWKKSGRWNDDVVDVWFKSTLKNGKEVGLANTHEEALAELVKKHVNSYKDLPVYIYQFQTKFRNELRAKSGILRGREFIMKDLYSFSKTKEEFEEFYEKAKEAYKKIFHRLGIGEETYLTFASGGSFSKYSHEFQTICEAGEDIIYVDKEKKVAINKEVLNDEVLNDLKIKREDLKEEKAIEVGNIFNLGTKYSEALELQYKDEKGESHNVYMGSYGIGPARSMGTIVELMSDDRGIVWPESVAPFRVHLIEVKSQKSKVKSQAGEIYEYLVKAGVEVLYDDRNLNPGEKFAEADLIGIPYQLIISEKNLKDNKVEIKNRKTGEVEYLEYNLEKISQFFK